MSPPLLGVEEEGRSDVTLLASSSSGESVCQKSMELLKECNYMGLSDSSSTDSSVISLASNETKTRLNLKDTELRLGLPGFQYPEREPQSSSLSSAQLDEKPLFPMHPSKDGHCFTLPKIAVSGNKRGFSDAMNGVSEKKFPSNSEVNMMLSPRNSQNFGLKSGSGLENLASKSVKEIAAPHPANETRTVANGSTNNSNAPATKAQVVGWPPIRSFRKNTLATTSKNNDEIEGKTGPGPLYVKVSMDGAPYLRKIDLRNYSAYKDLSSALEKMFSCFTIGQYGSHGALGRELLSEGKLKDLLHGSECVLTYEDKDSDWMLVGDVPWEMFINTCKRLRIMKSSDAIGLAPRAVEKCRNQA